MGPDDTLPTSILATLGLTPDRIRQLGSGLASEAWRVDAAGAASVLRIATRIDDQSTYCSEHAVMARLTAVGAAVPAPITGDWRHPGATVPPFSLTTFLPGRHLQAGASAIPVGQIADFLRDMHAIDAHGFGPLVQADDIHGQDADAVAGLRGRWSGGHAWLVDDIDLGFHPAWHGHRDLLGEIGRHAGATLDAALAGPMVLVHSDLHEENILDDGGRLAFIDLGETFRGTAGWEFAAMAYFLGWPIADAVLVAYLASSAEVRRWSPLVARLALSFGLSRWEQDRDLGVDGDADDVAFLRATLTRL